MRKAFVIAKKDIREALQGKTTYFYLIFLVLISLPYFNGFNNLISNLTKQGVSSVELRLTIQSFLNGIVSTLPLVLTMLFCSFLAGYSIITEKTNRTLESILATPLSVKQFWLGKSLAVALPSLAITILITSLSLLVMNLLYITSVGDSFIVPSLLPSLTGLIVIPVMAFLVVLIISLLQLVMTNPRVANFAYIGIFLLIYLGTMAEQSTSLNLGIIYGITTVVLAGITLFLTRFITKERVILSSKG